MPSPPPEGLGPYLSERTLEEHYRLQLGYAERVFDITNMSAERLLSVADVDLRSADEHVSAGMRNAAQVVNHDFYWKSMRPGGGGAPPAGTRAWHLVQGAGGWSSALRSRLLAEGMGRMGSGWLWLLVDRHRPSLYVVTTRDWATMLYSPFMLPLACCDLWEHAYYLDYYGERSRYLRDFLDHLLDWGHVEAVLRDSQR